MPANKCGHCECRRCNYYGHSVDKYIDLYQFISAFYSTVNKLWQKYVAHIHGVTAFSSRKMLANLAKCQQTEYCFTEFDIYALSLVSSGRTKLRLPFVLKYFVDLQKCVMLFRNILVIWDFDMIARYPNVKCANLNVVKIMIIY